MTHSANSVSMILAIALLVPMAVEAQSPEQPWRIMNGATNYAAGGSWKQFCGKVVEVQPHGVRIDGEYGEPGDVHYDSENYNYRDFFVKNFPYRVAEGDIIGNKQYFSAFEDGTYTYATTIGGSRTIHSLDYGIPCDAPLPSPEEIAARIEADKARKTALDKAKRESDARALKWNQDQADAGDPYGLLRMGERYRDGSGVETNTAKAREYLTKSAAMGNQTAKEELLKLNGK